MARLSRGWLLQRQRLALARFGSLHSGVSVFQRKWGTPDAPDVFTWRSEADPMSLRLLWQHKALVKPGQTWDSGEFLADSTCGGMG
jgi:hypothetical protein